MLDKWCVLSDYYLRLIPEYVDESIQFTKTGDMFWVLHRYSLFSPHQTRSVFPTFYLPYGLHIISCISDRFFKKSYLLRSFWKNVSSWDMHPLVVELAEDEINKKKNYAGWVHLHFFFQIYKPEPENAHHSAIKWEIVPKRAILVSPVAAKRGRLPPFFISLLDVPWLVLHNIQKGKKVTYWLFMPEPP